MSIESIKMKYIGFSEYDYPAYEDNKGHIWFDTNYGSGRIELYSSSGDSLEGEPYMPICDIYPNAEITFDSMYERNPRGFDYQMLSRYQSDCDYYLGHGNRNADILCFKDPGKHIAEMEKLYNSFEDNEKPEWLTWEDIQNYKKQMCGEE